MEHLDDDLHGLGGLDDLLGTAFHPSHLAAPPIPEQQKSALDPFLLAGVLWCAVFCECPKGRDE